MKDEQQQIDPNPSNDIETDTTDVDKESGNGEGKFDTLVIAGGGMKGICALGMLQYAYDNNLCNFTTLIGTSSGAITAFLILLGYSPFDILMEICSVDFRKLLPDPDLVSIYNGEGAIPYQIIEAILVKLMIQKECDTRMTMREFYEKTGKQLIMVTYNLTLDRVEYLSYLTHPDMPCLMAIKLSSSLPFVFAHVEYNGMHYTDGGVGNNFAIDIGEALGNRVLGVYIASNFRYNPTVFRPIPFLYKLIYTGVNRTIESSIEQCDKRKCTIVSDTLSFGDLLNFNMNQTDKMDMFLRGYKKCNKCLNQSH